ncbi:malonate decarboxylase subunit delta [Paenibacillus sp. Soil750]|uniref:malonate decarboxylase subunit delta n=1 Tax=Paenibacillus sp. Soil750 TaxID=1736398 RepID=UPI0006FC084C|nr:malonate decarboxylase subunit delta [Paenibacillus sp. Soil750]KRE55909.1 malonate decarboxylase acyl carrier protein [Paenibacillus sp. Soil750]
MEKLILHYDANKSISRRAHVGVAGSGDLEILIEPLTERTAQVYIRTQSDGFEETWKAIMDRFFLKHHLAARIEINDFGATPGVVSLRLAQAIEVLEL